MLAINIFIHLRKKITTLVVCYDTNFIVIHWAQRKILMRLLKANLHKHMLHLTRFLLQLCQPSRKLLFLLYQNKVIPPSTYVVDDLVYPSDRDSHLFSSSYYTCHFGNYLTRNVKMAKESSACTPSNIPLRISSFVGSRSNKYSSKISRSFVKTPLKKSSCFQVCWGY